MICIKKLMKEGEYNLKMNIPEYSVTPNGYQVNKVGEFARVSNILSMANFGNDILEKWKKKIRKESFSMSAPDMCMDNDIFPTSWRDWVDLWEKAYDAPDEYTKESAEFGTLLHEFLETYLTTGEVKDIKPHPYADVNICRDSMIKFINDWKLGPHTTVKAECLIYSEKYKYAGCIDYVAKLNDKIYIFDWKTTGRLHSKYLLQLSAYWVALEERAKDYGISEEIEHVYLVRFDKKIPKYEVIDFGKENMLYYFEIFKSLLNIYNFNKLVVL